MIMIMGGWALRMARANVVVEAHEGRILSGLCVATKTHTPGTRAEQQRRSWHGAQTSAAAVSGACFAARTPVECIVRCSRGSGHSASQHCTVVTSFRQTS